MSDKGESRCSWVGLNPLMIKYHDEEWGRPVHDDRKHFEYLLLDAFQAGLSWEIIINKRQGFREAFDNFDFRKIAQYDQKKVEELLQNKAIVRNRLKIHASIINAKNFMSIRKEFGSFDTFIWQLVGDKVRINSFTKMEEIPASTPLSDKVSLALKQRGFKFVGTTICYAYMQAAGMVNDHLVSCFRYPD